MSELLRATIALQEDSIQMLERKIECQADRIEALEADLREVLTNPGGEYYTGLHCGVEDQNITDHYEAADYGWDSAFEYIQSITKPPEDNQNGE